MVSDAGKECSIDDFNDVDIDVKDEENIFDLEPPMIEVDTNLKFVEDIFDNSSPVIEADLNEKDRNSQELVSPTRSQQQEVTDTLSEEEFAQEKSFSQENPQDKSPKNQAEIDVFDKISPVIEVDLNQKEEDLQEIESPTRSKQQEVTDSLSEEEFAQEKSSSQENPQDKSPKNDAEIDVFDLLSGRPDHDPQKTNDAIQTETLLTEAKQSLFGMENNNNL